MYPLLNETLTATAIVTSFSVLTGFAGLEEVEKFRRKMRWHGNTCLLVDYERADHSFFNFNVSHKNFESTMAAADNFLVERGLLDPEEDLELY